MSLLHENSFDDVIADGTVFIKIMTPTCGPCKEYAKIFDAFALNNKDIMCYTVDATQDPEIPARFSIRRVPTTLIFKNGKLVNTLNGVQTILDLEKEK